MLSCLGRQKNTHHLQPLPPSPRGTKRTQSDAGTRSPGRCSPSQSQRSLAHLTLRTQQDNQTHTHSHRHIRPDDYTGQQRPKDHLPHGPAGANQLVNPGSAGVMGGCADEASAATIARSLLQCFCLPASHAKPRPIVDKGKRPALPTAPRAMNWCRAL